jgi:hypothetical protein
VSWAGYVEDKYKRLRFYALHPAVNIQLMFLQRHTTRNILAVTK